MLPGVFEMENIDEEKLMLGHARQVHRSRRSEIGKVSTYFDLPAGLSVEVQFCERRFLSSLSPFAPSCADLSDRVERLIS